MRRQLTEHAGLITLVGLTVAAIGLALTPVLLVAGAVVAVVGAVLTLTAPRAAPPTEADAVAALLASAVRVVVVPGYGLALAQGQHALRALTDALGARGTAVVYGVHPVAGRMPGHLNAVLAAAGVPDEQQLPLDEVRLEGTVVLVVGANDVVNPAAQVPPAVDLAPARAVVVLNRSAGPGAAGVANPLFSGETTTLLLGDARRRLAEVSTALART